MNRLILNTEKTKVMVLNNRFAQSETTVSVDNIQVEYVNSIKYLGVIIDNKLIFKDHIDYLCKKISKKIGVLRKVRQNITMNCAVRVYNVVLKPHFLYCGSLLFLCHQYQKNKLQVLQNKAMRIILKCDRYIPVSFMVESLNWLNINQRLFMCAMQFVYKIKNAICPNYLRENVRTNEIPEHNLRNIHDLRIERVRTTRGQRTMQYMGFQTFNSLPESIKPPKKFSKKKNFELYTIKC